jgi:hypothetical protein
MENNQEFMQVIICGKPLWVPQTSAKASLEFLYGILIMTTHLTFLISHNLVVGRLHMQNNTQEQRVIAKEAWT